MVDLSWGSVGSGTRADEAAAASAERVQGSPEWHKWRGKGIGSSDAAVLLGWSPWKKIGQLLEEKLGLWTPVFGQHQLAAMERGKELEPKIRLWYENTFRNGQLFPDDTVTHPAKPHMRASFDGLNREFKNADGSVGRMIEIKAPNAKDHEMARLGEVPTKYQAQVQWLMLLGNVQWADYVSYGADGTYHVVEVKADPVMQRELEARADLFWKHVETRTEITDWVTWVRPMEPVDFEKAQTIPTFVSEQMSLPIPVQDPPQIAEQAIEGIVAEAIQAQEECDRAQVKFDLLKEKLKQILGKEEKMEKGEAVFGWQTRKGQVDYSVIPELIGLDLEQFRKQPTRAFYFKRKGQK